MLSRSRINKGTVVFCLICFDWSGGGGVGWGDLASENVSRRVQSESHSLRWRVLPKFSFQPVTSLSKHFCNLGIYVNN